VLSFRHFREDTGRIWKMSREEEEKEAQRARYRRKILSLFLL